MKRQGTALIGRCFGGLDVAELREEVLRRLRRSMAVDAASETVFTTTSIACGSTGTIIVPAFATQNPNTRHWYGNLRVPASVSLYCCIDRS